MAAGKHLIYCLTDPRSGLVRYIGKSSSGLTRARAHYRIAWNGRSQFHVHRWIRSLGGDKPIVEVIEETSKDLLADAEIFYISYFRSLGFDLTNQTDGGEGCLGRAGSDLQRRRASETHKGKRLSQESRLALSRSQGGRPFYDQNGVVYDTIHEASRQLGIMATTICAVLKGRQRSVYGFRFAYVGEPLAKVDEFEEDYEE